MSLDADDEILKDFLVEAHEILELLSEQLVQLETEPENTDLLNAIFRGFHTVKGGAGFLAITPLVEVCHISENIFDSLRQGKRAVDPDLMDSILQALDTINQMFAEIEKFVDPPAASAELLQQLGYLAEGLTSTGQTIGDFIKTEPALPEKSDSPDDEMTDDDFHALLDVIQGRSEESSAPCSDEITEEEFEALLDQQTAGVTPKLKEVVDPAPSPVKKESSPAPAAKKKSSSTPAPKKEMTAETTVRVDIGRLDDIMNMVGELVLVRNRLVKLKDNFANENLTKAVGNLDVVTADLQMAVMKTRMQPIKKVFGRFPRVVRDLARQLDKDIVLTMSGEDTDLDKNLVDALADPLVHLVRNSVDHGIEMPDERAQIGKSRTGTILLSAEQAGDHILLSIEDDGRGMDAEVLRQKVIEKGLIDEDSAHRLTDKECFNLIFMPGFSTKEQISDISGRGVGMDVVKTQITNLNGSLDISSSKDVGTKIQIKVPLTLAILPTLMIRIDAQTFALPLASVNEIFHFDLTKTHQIDGQLVVVIRNKTIPLFYLQHWLGTTKPRQQTLGHVVIVSLGTTKVGFVVDSLLGQEEVVIKALGDNLQGTPGIAGATTTGDGKIALILDIPGLLAQYAHKKNRCVSL